MGKYTNEDQIIDYLATIGMPVELRIPKTDKGTISGYYDDAEILASDVTQIVECGQFGKITAVYTTVNELDPQIVARRHNKYTITRDESSTTDSNIQQRLWLLIDADPQRPKDVSASDDQHDGAIKLVKRVRDYLAGLGFPEPMLNDSGNGGHLMYAVKLPPTNEVRDLFKSFLEAIARRFDTPELKIDQAVFNSARIWKLPGTMARKGDEVQGCRWRMAKVLYKPETIETLTIDLIRKAIADNQPTFDSTPLDQLQGFQPEFDQVLFVSRFLVKHGIASNEPRMKDGGTLWQIHSCPFCGESDKSHAILATPNKGIGYRCLHARCVDKRWKDFRKHFEPDYGKPKEPTEETEASNAGREPSVAKQLVRFVEMYTERVFNFSGDPYAVCRDDRGLTTYTMKSSMYEHWLTRLWERATGGVLGDTDRKKALAVMSSRAMFAETVEPHLRSAEHGGNIYLDLANPAGEIVKITRKGWEIVTDAPVVFFRNQNTDTLPTPTRGGSVELFRRFVNIADSDWSILLAWILDTLKGRGPYHLAILNGRQGTAKSFTAEMLARVVDPLKMAQLNRLSKDNRELAIKAMNRYVLVCDNVSELTQAQSDDLCCLATGAGYSTRKLFKDSDEAIFSASRPIILTGIPDFTRSLDLLDRSLIFTLPTIERYVTEQVLRQEFAEAHPKILGALLDLVVVGLNSTYQPTIDHRMMDSFQFMCRCSTGTSWGVEMFVADYLTKRDEALQIGLDACPVADVLRDYLEKNGGFKGAASELLDKLNAYLGNSPCRPDRSYPTSGRDLMNCLRRYQPALKQLGIEFLQPKKSNGKRVMEVWIVGQPDPKPKPPYYDYGKHPSRGLLAAQIKKAESVSVIEAFKRSDDRCFALNSMYATVF